MKTPIATTITASLLVSDFSVTTDAVSASRNFALHVPSVTTRIQPTHIVTSIPRGGEGTSPQDSTDTGDSNDDDNNDDDNNSSHRTNHPLSPVCQEILDHPHDLYRVLGILSPSSSITSAQITKAYRRRAVQTHPDKTGGDRRAFDIVARAHDILSNPEERKLYDRWGWEGYEQYQQQQMGGSSGGTTTSMSDLFRDWFHQHQQQQQEQEQYYARQRMQSVRVEVQISLEDMYLGTNRTILMGSPMRRGRRPQEIPVTIPKGARSGQTIVLKGALEQPPTSSSRDNKDNKENNKPIDVILILTQAPHATFARKNYDLVMTWTISWKEALCGVTRSIRLLDGRMITVESARRRQPQTMNGNKGNAEGVESSPVLIHSGDVQVLQGYGFPKAHHDDNDDKNNVDEYGDLYIQFQVDQGPIPTESDRLHPRVNPLSAEERTMLTELLTKVEMGHQSTTTSTTTTSATTTASIKPESRRRRRKKSRATTAIKEEEKEELEEESTATTSILRLEPSLASHFGRASGIPPPLNHHHHHPDDDEDYAQQHFSNPFFGGGSGTTSWTSFTYGPGAGASGFYSSSGTFGRSSSNGDDTNDDVPSCRTM